MMTSLGTDPAPTTHADAKAQAKAAKAYAKATRPWFKKKRFLLPIAVVVIAVLSQMGGGGDDAAAPAAADSTTQTTQNDAEATADDSKDDSAATEADNTPALGDAVRDGKFEFTVKKVDCGKKSLGPAGFGTKAQGQFCLVNLKVENIGDEAQSMFGDNQLLFDEQGRQFSADTEAAIYLDNAEMLWEEINPGNTLNGVVVFDVPKDAKPESIELHDSLFSGGVTVSLS